MLNSLPRLPSAGSLVRTCFVVAGALTVAPTQALSLSQLLHKSHDTSMPILSQISEPNIDTDPAQMLTQLASQIEQLAQLGSKSTEEGEIITAMDATQTLSTLETEQAAADKTGEMTDGMMAIAKQLVSMADKLPIIKQCMADVKSGKYKVSDPAKIAAGGTLEPQKEPETGLPVKIIIDPTKKLISNNEVISIPEEIKAAQPAVASDPDPEDPEEDAAAAEEAAPAEGEEAAPAEGEAAPAEGEAAPAEGEAAPAAGGDAAAAPAAPAAAAAPAAPAAEGGAAQTDAVVEAEGEVPAEADATASAEATTVTEVDTEAAADAAAPAEAEAEAAAPAEAEAAAPAEAEAATTAEADTAAAADATAAADA